MVYLDPGVEQVAVALWKVPLSTLIRCSEGLLSSQRVQPRTVFPELETVRCQGVVPTI